MLADLASQTRIIASIGLFALAACGASPGQGVEEPIETTPTEVDPVTRADLDQTALDAIQSALATRIGFPVRVVGHVADGEGQLVVYTMNGLTHWLALREDREALTREIQACEDAGGSEPQSCADVTLRSLRREDQFRAYVARCMTSSEADDPNAREGCENEAENMLVFDVEAYCDRGFWARARREGDGWAVTLAGALPELCLAELLSLRSVDVDADGQQDLLVDAVYSHMDSMRLTTDSHARTLARYDATAAEPVRRGAAIRLASYPADMSDILDLRCNYEVIGAPRGGLELECCLEPTPENGLPETPEGEARHFPTWPPNEHCSAHWTETHSPVESGGFSHCGLVVTADETPIRAEPSATAEIVDTAPDRMEVRRVGERGEWIELLYGEAQRGWILRRQTHDDCASPR